MAEGPATAQTMQAIYQEHFGSGRPGGSLAMVAQQYAASNDTDLITENAALTKTVAATRDVVDTVLTFLATTSLYIHLSMPKMEDGNNFGVTVQLAALKHMADLTDKLAKGWEETCAKYASARAEALEKCKFLPATSTVTSTTTLSSSSVGNTTEKGDATATEEKKTTGVTISTR
jgi:Proteasome activator pa28 beta subunit